MDLAYAVLARSHYRGNMSPGGAVLLLVVLGLFVFLVWYFGKTQRIKRELAAAPRWSIAELPESTLGRIVGAAKPLGDPLTSPLGGTPCVFYRAVVMTGGKYQKEVCREERSVGCLVEDASGRAIVDVEGAELVLGEDSVTSSGTFDNPTDVERAFLAKHGVEVEGVVFNRSYTYRESTISVGEVIAVLGAGVREPDPEAPPTEAYRGAPAMRLRLTSTPRWKLRISDHPSTTA